MAFTNVRSVPLQGGLSLLVGSFTQSAGGGSQTLALGTSWAVILAFDPKVSSEPVDCRAALTTDSQSGLIDTLTIYGNSAVTGGVFAILINAGG